MSKRRLRAGVAQRFMPVVFLHGVSTRSNPRTARQTAARDALIRAALLHPPDASVLNPAWGDLLGPLSPPDNPIVPRAASVQALSTAAGEMVPPASGVAPGFADAVDAFFARAMEDVPAGKLDTVAEAAIDSARYARAEPRPGWFDPANDADLAADLERAIGRETVQLAGSGETVPAGFLHPIAATFDAVRPRITQAAASFLGDVFGYLGTRGSKSRPGPIPKLVTEALDDARLAANKLGAPLIVIGHSMGGNIAFDVIGFWRPRLKIDCLVTVGSQVALFRQLNLFPAAPVGSGKAARPENVREWVNVIDPSDALAFLCAPEFRGVKDRDYRTDAGIFGAHNAYFERASFFERLSAYTQGTIRE